MSSFRCMSKDTRSPNSTDHSVRSIWSATLYWRRVYVQLNSGCAITSQGTERFFGSWLDARKEHRYRDAAIS